MTSGTPREGNAAGLPVRDMGARRRPAWETLLPRHPATDTHGGMLALRRQEVEELQYRLDAAVAAMVDAERVLANEACRVHGDDACESRFAEAAAGMASEPERIAGASIRTSSGTIATLAPPARHHHLIFMLAAEGHPPIGPRSQGFVTTKGRFVDRVEGLAIAEAAGQVVRKHPSFDKLYSEDMW